MTQTLDELRAVIDAADAELVAVLARRFQAVEGVAAIKARDGLPVVDPARIEIVQDRVAGLAAEAGLDPGIARRLWRAIIDEAVAMENEKIG
ncbi:MAG: chorismate mutase [Proteobacteria bacterium]|nr:chorismate mutase [Pseudomonadota bacterium]MDA1033097.1 chorismate mutase [Pseudomonadota bacterium]